MADAAKKDKKARFKPTNLKLDAKPADDTPDNGPKGQETRTGSWAYEDIIKVGRDGIRKEQTPASGISAGVAPQANPDFDNVVSIHNEKINWEDLKVLGKLGSGASASVKKVQNMKTKQEYAQKVIITDKEEKAKTIMAELKSLNDCNSDFVVRMYDAFYREGAINLLLEYMNCGSLEDVYKTVGKVPEPIVANIAVQVLKGLRYLHVDKKIVHRDLKPANILVNHKGYCKVADLGMAGFNQENETFQGTFTHMSPERIKGNKHGFDSDLWSLGILLAECAVGKFPIDIKEMNLFALLKKLEDEKVLRLPAELSEDLADFVHQCCQYNPADRPSIDQLLTHKFIVGNTSASGSTEEATKVVSRWLKDTFIKIKKEKAAAKK